MTDAATLATIALDVAIEAGQQVARGFRSRPTPDKKSRTDLVTTYDLASERLIRDRLARATPDIAIVGEEQGGAARGPSTWWVDPLDGTTNFVHGHPFWAVSIGALDGEGVPLAGAVVAPALGVQWHGWRGGPALRNGEPCRVSPTTALDDTLVATGFPQQRDTAPDDNFDAFIRVKRQVRGIRRCGAAAIDLCYVADGTYDAYWERKLNAWDIAAGAAIVLAAGGTITALDGGRARLEIGHVLASNGHVHTALVPLVA